VVNTAAGRLRVARPGAGGARRGNAERRVFARTCYARVDGTREQRFARVDRTHEQRLGSAHIDGTRAHKPDRRKYGSRLCFARNIDHARARNRRGINHLALVETAGTDRAHNHIHIHKAHNHIHKAHNHNHEAHNQSHNHVHKAHN
jgi:hypothetical protein